jgi:hypothetical protein
MFASSSQVDILLGRQGMCNLLIAAVTPACVHCFHVSYSTAAPQPDTIGAADTADTADTAQQGTLVTLAIGLHNVPEGLAVATVMAAKGTSPRRTLLWTALTALPQALVAPPAFVFVDTFRWVWVAAVCQVVVWFGLVGWVGGA